tara:strand:- start:1045 stop:1230 length:186 start_codon:yes stop_codon:yes gene_type:complete
MKILPNSVYVGAIVTSTLILSYTTASIGGSRNCLIYFNDWKVLGSIGSLGSFLGAYYVKNN